MGLKIEGNRIEGHTALSYYSDPVESKSKDGKSFQEASIDIDNALLNRANNLWLAFYKTKKCVNENWYTNEPFYINDLSNRETEKVLIQFSDDGNRTRIFTRLLISLDTYINGDGLTIVEWSDFIEEILPKDRLVISIAYEGETSRKISLHAIGKEYEELVKGL